MFQMPANRLRSWWSARTADILGGDLDDSGGDIGSDEDPELTAQTDLDHFLSHPHRARHEWRAARRGGSVPPSPAHCLTPVRNGGAPPGSRSPARPPSGSLWV